MTANFLQKTEMQFPNLTDGLKKVADGLLSDPMMFAIHPAKKVGEILNVSETMVIRFSRSIGYAGFSSLQKEIRQYLLEFKQDTVKKDTTVNAFTKSFYQDITMIERNLDKLNNELLNILINTMIRSNRIIIAGYHHSFTFAHWMYFNLNYILGNAILYQPETDAGLLDLPPEKKCIIIFSFYRYALDTIRLAEVAKKKGIKVIAFTDSRVAPIVDFADIIIPITTNQHHFFSKGPVTLAYINAILIELIERVEKIGKVQSTYKYFIKDVED